MPTIKFQLADSRYFRRNAAMNFGLTATPSGASLPDCELCISPVPSTVCRDYWTPNTDWTYKISASPSLSSGWNTAFDDIISPSNWETPFTTGSVTFPFEDGTEVNPASSVDYGQLLFGSELNNSTEVIAPGTLELPLVAFDSFFFGGVDVTNPTGSGSCELSQNFPIDITSTTTYGTTAASNYTDQAPATIPGPFPWSPPVWDGIEPGDSLSSLQSAYELFSATSYTSESDDPGYLLKVSNSACGAEVTETLTGAWGLNFRPNRSDSNITLSLEYTYTSQVVFYFWYARTPYDSSNVPAANTDVDWDVRLAKAVWAPAGIGQAYDVATGDCILHRNLSFGEEPSDYNGTFSSQTLNAFEQTFSASWTNPTSLPDPDFQDDPDDVLVDLEEVFSGVSTATETEFDRIWYGPRSTSASARAIAPVDKTPVSGTFSWSQPSDNNTSHTVPSVISSTRSVS